MKKAQTRSSLSKSRNLRLRREERSEREMGDLHLKRYGMGSKSRRNFRYRVKHYSSKVRRRRDKALAREWTT